MKFIRGKPFQGLEDYFYSPEIKMTHKRLKYPLSKQSSFQGLEHYGSVFELEKKLGHFHEKIIYGIYGGKLKQIQKINSDLFKNNFSEPDLTTKKNHFESKAVAPGGALNLLDKQIPKYAILQIGGFLKHKKYVRFEIFRHGIRKLHKNYKNDKIEELISDLSKTTKFMLSLPFSLIFHLWSAETPFTSRYTGDKWVPTTRFFSSGLNSMLAYPKETIEIIGLDPNEFIFKKRRFPMNVSINKNKLKPFPILKVFDKDPKQWLCEFKEKHKGKNLTDFIDEISKKEQNDNYGLPF